MELKATKAIFLLFILTATVFSNVRLDVRGDLINPAALTTNDPIYISADTDFDADHGVVAGNGTSSNPYIIENLSINANSTTGIYITGTNSYFIIRNCYIFNGSELSNSEYGIDIDSVTNGAILNNRLENNFYDIYMVSSSQMTVSDNYLSSSYGNSIYASVKDSVITGNEISDSGYHAIECSSCSNVTINLNTISDSTHGLSISLQYSTGINAANNDISGSYGGFEIYDDTSDVLSSNTMTDIYTTGIYLWGSSEIALIYNHVNNANGYSGIVIESSSDNNVSYNQLLSTSSGIYLANSPNNKIVGNEVKGQSDWALQVVSGSYSNNIASNLFHSGTNGVQVRDSDNNELDDNMIADNSGKGLDIERCGKVTMKDNQINNNGFNFNIVWDYLSQLEHDIDTSNTIGGKPIYYLVSEKNIAVPSNAGFLGIIESKAITADSLALARNNPNVLIVSSDKVSITNSNLGEATWGLVCQDSTNVVIGSTTFEDQTGEGGGSVIITGESNNIRIFNGAFYSSYYGVHVSGPDIYNIAIDDNYFTGGNTNVHVDSAYQTDIYDNLMTGASSYGITIQSSPAYGGNGEPNNNVYGNTIQNTNNGIEMQWVYDSWINGNQLTNNDCSICIDYSNDNEVSDNAIGSSGTGLEIGWSSGNTVKGNTIRNSYDIGIEVSTSQNTLVFNNYFNNTDNLVVDNNHKNTWNVSRTIGTNIIGGPCLGGNYWSDYTGKDKNYDGLGDTKVPYGSGDRLPLVYIDLSGDTQDPTIEDKTSQSPTTGDLFTFRAQANDDRFIRYVYVEYWFDAGPHFFNDLALSGGTYRNGSFKATIQVSSSAVQMHYILWVEDHYSNLGSTTETILSVADNDAPTIFDVTATPSTGDDTTFIAEISDNIGMDQVTFDYWYNAGSHTSTDPSSVGDIYSLDTTVPDDALVLHLNISSSDGAGNWKNITVNFTVKDNDLPTAVDKTPAGPTTGDHFTFKVAASDNIAIKSVQVEYWYYTGAHMVKALDLAAGVYSKTVMVNMDAKDLHYIITVLDTSLNKLVLPKVDLTVMDNDPPELYDVTDQAPRTGESFELKATALDNLGVTGVWLKYWFDQDTPVNVSLSLSKYYSLEIPAPLTATMFHYLLSAQDVSGLWTTLPKVDVKVLDIVMPELLDNSADPISGLPFEFKINAQDNLGQVTVGADYWFDGGHPSTMTLTLDGQDFTGTIDVPSTSRVLHYIITVLDSSKNSNSTTIAKDVLDTTLPTIIDLTKVPTTGDGLDITFKTSDNWGVDHYSIDYWFDQSPVHTVVKKTLAHLSVPTYAKILHYKITVIDISNNSNTTTIDKNVLDNDPPSIIDHSPQRCNTSSEYTFKFDAKDNIGVSSVSIRYTFDGIHWTNVSDPLAPKISVPATATRLLYWIVAKDDALNQFAVFGQRPVKDTIPPTVGDVKVDYARAGLVMTATATDNIGIENLSCEYWFDGGFHHWSYFQKVGGQYQAVLIPYGFVTLHYIVEATDTSGNLGNVNGDLTINTLLDIGLSDTSGTPRTGEPFNVTYQLQHPELFGTVYLKYWFDNDTFREIRCTDSCPITISAKAKVLHYTIKSVDANGVIEKVSSDRNIVDSLGPNVVDLSHGSTTAVGEYDVAASVSDNRGVKDVQVVYWFDQETSKKNISVPGSKDIYYFPVDCKKGCKVLHYAIVGTDFAGNSNTIPAKNVEIREDIQETPQETSGTDLAPFAVVLLVVLVCVILMVLLIGQKRKKDREKMSKKRSSKNTK